MKNPARAAATTPKFAAVVTAAPPWSSAAGASAGTAPVGPSGKSPLSGARPATSGASASSPPVAGDGNSSSELVGGVAGGTATAGAGGEAGVAGATDGGVNGDAAGGVNGAAAGEMIVGVLAGAEAVAGGDFGLEAGP